ncbi:MAG: DUF3137 domain-containing protein [Alphaproteobacteria bacterium]|nr:DUF3137 domain-containing protein [Alphaproteobacteria bacterium]
MKKNAADNPELAATQERFMQFYKEKLQSVYEDLEEDRQACLFSLACSIIGIIIVFGGIFSLFYFDILSMEVLDSQWFAILISILLLIAMGLIFYPFNYYNSITKSRAMNKILSFWGKYKYFNGKDLIGESVIKKSELFGYFNGSSSDDAFWGYHNEVELDVSEHDLRIKGRKGDTIIFRGAIIRLDFPKKFKGKTVVLNKGRNWNFIWNNPVFMLLLATALAPFGIYLYHIYLRDLNPTPWILITLAPMLIVLSIYALIYLFYRHKNPLKATQKVVLEGLPFLKKWKVLTSSQIEARYLLTPVFMEKMLEIKRLFHGKHIDFSFFNNQLLIAVHTSKDLFETTSLFTPALSYHKMREVVSQLQSIFAVIDLILNDSQIKK